MASALSMDAFVQAALQVKAGWTTMSPKQRVDALVAAANEQLKAAGVMPCIPKMVDLPPGTLGRFDWEPWMIEMNKVTFSAPTVDQQEAAKAANTVFHEARHAEQLYNVARLMAGQGKGQAEIVKVTKISPIAVQQAVQRPINDAAESAKAQQNYDSIFGAKSQERDRILQAVNATASELARLVDEHTRLANDPNSDMNAIRALIKQREATKKVHRENERQYKNLPEEKDAFQVGDTIEALFLFADGQ
jgi:hypothetical protein